MVDHDYFQRSKLIRLLITPVITSALPWKNLAAECNLNCTSKTPKRVLTEQGYHKCVTCPKLLISKSAHQQQIKFIDDHLSWLYEWEDVIWSDECTFYTGKQRKAMVIHTPQERYCSYMCQNQY